VDSEEEDEVPHLEIDDDGYPLLPSVGHMNLNKQKAVIRLYLQIIYRMFWFYSSLICKLMIFI
jgi:hypothetical protein